MEPNLFWRRNTLRLRLAAGRRSTRIGSVRRAHWCARWIGETFDKNSKVAYKALYDNYQEAKEAVWAMAVVALRFDDGT